MKVFVIFGLIEFIDGDAYVRTTDYAGFYFEDSIERTAKELDMDYITPHYFAGRIIFNKLQKESWE
jgi:vancomycin permeability regulator SanA